MLLLSGLNHSKILKTDCMTWRGHNEFIVPWAITYLSEKFGCPLDFLIREVEFPCSPPGVKKDSDSCISSITVLETMPLIESYSIRALFVIR